MDFKKIQSETRVSNRKVNLLRRLEALEKALEEVDPCHEAGMQYSIGLTLFKKFQSIFTLTFFNYIPNT